MRYYVIWKFLKISGFLIGAIFCVSNWPPRLRHRISEFELEKTLRPLSAPNIWSNNGSRSSVMQGKIFTYFQSEICINSWIKIFYWTFNDWRYKMIKSVHESKFNSMSASGDYVVKNKLLIAVENEDLPLLAVQNFSWLRTGLSNRIRKFCKYFNFWYFTFAFCLIQRKGIILIIIDLFL